MRRLRLGAALAGIALLAACDVTYTDVSNNRHLAPLVGTRYQVLGQVTMYGIGTRRSGALSYITLSPMPMDGPEFVFSRELPRGAVITVEKVLKTNRWPDSNRVFQVRLHGVPVPPDTFVTVELFRGNESDIPWKLNPALYRELPRK
jgi:hypothetical protein